MFLKNKMIFSAVLFSIGFAYDANADADDNGNIFRVVNVGREGILNLRAGPSPTAKVVLELPRNARWIVKRQANSVHGRSRSGWQKIDWNNHQGWVNASYLQYDPEATKIKQERLSCLKNNPKIPACCGYPQQQFKGKLYPIQVYNIQKVDDGQSLNMRKQAGRNAQILSTIPHDGVGIVKLPQQRVKKGTATWEKVRWNGQNGWVNSYYLRFDPELSKSREHIREICH